ncbi:hypothetical protein BGW39_009809, partial [Mortierella sp. 14UC]
NKKNNNNKLNSSNISFIMDSPIDKVFTSPELITLIGWNLNKKSVSQFSKTNRFIHMALAPLLWHTLDLTDLQREYRLIEKSNNLQQFASNINHVRELTARTTFLCDMVDSMARNSQEYASRASRLYNGKATPTTTLPPSPWLTTPALKTHIRVILPPLTRLKRLKCIREIQYDDFWGNAEPDPPIAQQLAWLFNLNPGLTVIHMNSVELESSLEVRLFARSLLRLEYLKELDLGVFTNLDWTEVLPALFFSLPPSLETLTLHNDISSKGKPFNSLSEDADKDQTGNKTGQPLPRRDTPLTRLKNLHIITLTSSSVEMLCPLLEYCPALESMTAPNWSTGGYFPIMPLFIQAVREHCPLLRQLNGCSKGTVALAEGLPKNTLECFIVDGGYHDGEELSHAAAAVIKNHGESLKEIRINDRSHVRSGTIRRIFEQCTALEHLSIKGGDLTATRLVTFGTMFWNCKTLKSLEITIDMRRSVIPAFVYVNRGQPMPNVDEAMWGLLEKFYKHLGKLTELEVLNLKIRSQEVKWLDDDGHVRRGGEHIRSIINWADDDDYGVSYSHDVFSVDDNRGYFSSQPSDNLEAKAADASFPALLSLGDESIGRRGYLSYLGGLTKLRELRGHVQATTSETSKTFGQREVEWILEHWPNLKVIELLPALRDRQGEPRRLLPMNLSPPHIVWLQQQRPDLCITQQQRTGLDTRLQPSAHVDSDIVNNPLGNIDPKSTTAAESTFDIHPIDIHSIDIHSIDIHSIDIHSMATTGNPNVRISKHRTLTPQLWSSLVFPRPEHATRFLRLMLDEYPSLRTNIQYLHTLKVDTEALKVVSARMSKNWLKRAGLGKKRMAKILNSTFLRLSAPQLVPPPLPPAFPLHTTATPGAAPKPLSLPAIFSLTTLEVHTRPQRPLSDDKNNGIHNSDLLPINAFLLANRYLVSVHVQGCNVAGPILAEAFIRAVSHLQYLQELDLGFGICAVDWGHLVLGLLYALPRSLETLRLCCQAMEREPGESLDRQFIDMQVPLINDRRTRGLVRRTGPFGRLRELQVEYAHWEDTVMLKSFIELCPVLEKFSPPHGWDDEGFRHTSAILARTVVRYCPRIRELNTFGQGTSEILDVLPRNTLQVLSDASSRSEWDGDSILYKVVLSQYHSIQEIRVEHCKHVSGAEVQAILWSCVTLEQLTIKGPETAATRLKYLVEQDWVCLRLKRLEMTVDLRRMHIPAFVLEQTGQPVSTVDGATWAMLEKFYCQLGALTDMRVLNLRIKSKELWWIYGDGHMISDTVDDTGDDYRDPDYDDSDNWSIADDDEGNWTCQDPLRWDAENADASFPAMLSLGDVLTGRPGYLSHLSGLTHLEELRGNVQATTSETLSTVGWQEVEWMMAHWPRLKAVELLPSSSFLNFQGDSQGARRKLEAFSHIVWLHYMRPDLCLHAGSD